MLDGTGLHKLVWNYANERFSSALIASPTDAQGCGIALEVRHDVAPANLAGRLRTWSALNVHFLSPARASYQGAHPTPWWCAFTQILLDATTHARYSSDLGGASAHVVKGGEDSRRRHVGAALTSATP